MKSFLILILSCFSLMGQSLDGPEASVFNANVPAASGGAWTPTSPGNLAAWWKTDAGTFSDLGTTPCVNSTLCEQLNDQSGNAVNATQTTVGKRGSYFTGVRNGLPVIVVTNNLSSGDFMSITMSVAAGSKTFFLAYSNATVSADPEYCLDTASGRLVIAPVSVSLAGHTGWYDGTWNELTTVTTGWHTYIWVLTAAGNGTVYFDGVSLGSIAYTSKAIGGATTLWSQNDGAADWLNGHFGEMGVYSIALGGSDVTSLQAYLKARWNTP